MLSKLASASKPVNFSFALPKTVIEQLRKKFKEVLKNVVFRRVGSVIYSKDAHLEYAVEYIPVQNEQGNVIVQGTEIDHFDSKKYSEEKIKQNIELHYNMFACFCSTEELRPETKLTKKQQIFIASGKYNEPDFLLSHTFGILFEDELRDNDVPPRVGDLICLEAVIGPKGIPQAKWWFNCSDQFMHLWTYIMFPEHPSISRIPNPLTGNYLQTNTYLKWILGYNDAGEKVPLDEAKKRYFRLRTEAASRKYVHVYCALYVMMVQGVLPNWKNVPNNQSETRKIKEWDIPEDFVDRVLRTHTTFFDDLPSDDFCKKSVKNIVFGRGIEPLKVHFDKSSLPPKGVQPNLAMEDFPSLSSKGEKSSAPKEEKKVSVDEELIKKLEDVIRSDFAKKQEDARRAIEEEMKEEMKALEERYKLLLSSRLKDVEASMQIAIDNIRSSFAEASKK